MTNLTIGTLFTNKRGAMFVVSDITEYNYKGEKRKKVTYYPISGESGLITKTKAYQCSSIDLDNKFNILDWKF